MLNREKYCGVCFRPFVVLFAERCYDTSYPINRNNNDKVRTTGCYIYVIPNQ